MKGELACDRLGNIGGRAMGVYAVHALALTCENEELGYQSSLHWMKTSSRSPEDALTETSRSANRMTRQDDTWNLQHRFSIV
jgi:hypothetical protein